MKLIMERESRGLVCCSSVNHTDLHLITQSYINHTSLHLYCFIVRKDRSVLRRNHFWHCWNAASFWRMWQMSHSP